MRIQSGIGVASVMSFISVVTMNNRNFQKISLLHKPKNAKSFGEGSYVFSTPTPLYEHGLENEESRGIGYYMLNDKESGEDFKDSDQFDYDEYEDGVNEHKDNYNTYQTPSNFDYSKDFSGNTPSQYDESEYSTKKYQNDDGIRNKPETFRDYDYVNENSSKEHYNDHEETEGVPFLGKELEANLNSYTNERDFIKRKPALKLSKSMMDNLYLYLSQRFDDTSKKPRTGKHISYEPESRQQNPATLFGSKKSKQKEHHHHHFNQEHGHTHKHLQNHGHEHEHVENHTYYNNHKHNHKHDHFHDHVEKNEHKQGHKHLHSHNHEHKGHGYSSHTESLQPSKGNVDQQRETTEHPTGYNNDVKAYINEHKIKTFNGFKGFVTEHNELDGDYMEEVEYLDTE